jgi:hypothetical protein
MERSHVDELIVKLDAAINDYKTRI